MKTKKLFIGLIIILCSFMMINCNDSGDDDDDDGPTYFIEFTISGTTYTYEFGETADDPASAEYDSLWGCVKIFASDNGLNTSNGSTEETPGSIFIILDTTDLNITGNQDILANYMFYTEADGSHFFLNDDLGVTVNITNNSATEITGNFSGGEFVYLGTGEHQDITSGSFNVLKQ